MAKRVELALAPKPAPGAAAKSKRAATVSALESIFDKSTVRLVTAALETRTQAADAETRRRKLCLTDLVRQSASASGLDYAPFNAWLVNVFVDEELLRESESIT